MSIGPWWRDIFEQVRDELRLHWRWWLWIALIVGVFVAMVAWAVSAPSVD